MPASKKNSGGDVPRDELGRVLPGHSLNPGGRATKRKELAYLEALKRALPPEQTEELIAKALQIAVAQNSWRGIAAVLELALAYGVGKPTQRIQHSDGNLEELMQLLRQGPGSVDAMLGSSSSSSSGSGSGSGSGSKPTVADSSSSSNGSSSGSGE